MSWKYLVTTSALFATALAGAPGAVLAASCDPPPVVACDKVGPQSPRDIEQRAGENPLLFAMAPPADNLSLCDIHFHRFAEHKIPGTRAAGSETAEAASALAPGKGYVCRAGEPLAAAADGAGEASEGKVCNGVGVGDTVEVHWVYTTCDVEPGPCLGSCFSKDCVNPQLRVEAQVFYLTPAGHPGADDWARAGYGQAPPKSDSAVEYLGSTTGDKYDADSLCSPFQVTWRVRPECRALTQSSLGLWCDDNEFGEDRAHGVRDLLVEPALLSRIR